MHAAASHMHLAFTEATTCINRINRLSSCDAVAVPAIRAAAFSAAAANGTCCEQQVTSSFQGLAANLGLRCKQPPRDAGHAPKQRCS
ncbi:uncharacterized protein TrAtP1_007268 [Trichoderma atroviride]|uniref:uncharacterized protein n=1 Tax=Hypocrea atroviridis TaxID=63577 RepID=UPI003328879F|nr:hypothetical protein TrAtP1_007268 [Trichoderma atroviride]